MKGREGLSPRVRGNLDEPVEAVRLAGSIPACAGEPWTTCRRNRLSKVYPRVCGGTSLPHARRSRGGGLSPRVRGNRAARTCWPPGAGSIPACAGEPGKSGQESAPVGVYPRVCGGTRIQASRPSTRLGLSPRVRGNQVCDGIHLGLLGSIPACAGEPSRANPTGASARVYPRVCGGTSSR